MKQAVLIVLDSVGIGAMHDAELYGDAGANTLVNMGKKRGRLNLENLASLGLGHILSDYINGIPRIETPVGSFGILNEKSKGKDTTTGHWEMCGVILSEPFALFPNGFDPEIIEEFSRRTGRGVIGNKAASGTEIISELGEEHIRSGKWIIYTSADSVFQIAAHEEVIPLDELYRGCEIAREICDRLRIGRVIARPFVGSPGSFKRTYNRKDFSMLPPHKTALDILSDNGISVTGIGKIYDIFAGRGVTVSIHTDGNADGIEKTISSVSEKRGMIFVNLVDYDMVYGHRRDIEGYASALEYFDSNLLRITENIGKDSLLIITADHGCDPTFKAHTDHTRERVPLLVYSPSFKRGVFLGTRETFADIGKSILEWFEIESDLPGNSFLPELK
ncbi:MAG: phosphopentomutase [Deltaproteobacteria bacterium]|nr:phosphopentomutase [Deltaproteobacteria bacterium]